MNTINTQQKYEYQIVQDDAGDNQFFNIGSPLQQIQDRMERLGDRISNVSPRSNNKSPRDQAKFKDFFSVQTRVGHVVEQAGEQVGGIESDIIYNVVQQNDRYDRYAAKDGIDLLD